MFPAWAHCKRPLQVQQIKNEFNMKRAITVLACLGAVACGVSNSSAEFVGYYGPGAGNLNVSQIPGAGVLVNANWRVYMDAAGPTTDANAFWFTQSATPDPNDALQLGIFGNGNNSFAVGTIYVVCTVDTPEDGMLIQTKYTGSVFGNNAIDKIWFVYDDDGLDLTGKMPSPDFYQLVPPSGGAVWTTPFAAVAGAAFGWAIYSDGNNQTGPSGTFDLYFVPEPSSLAMAGVALIGASAVAVRSIRRKKS